MAEYELIYWPSLPGRGEFVRLVLEAGGASYSDIAAKSIPDSAQAVLGLIAESNIGDATNPPIFAPPFLRHGDLSMNQTMNILRYLAPKFGLEGDGSEATKVHLASIAATIFDGLCNEAHETHHPIASSAYYEDQKPEAAKRAKNYIEERLPKFLTYVTRVLKAKTSGGGPWLYGGTFTYADIVLFQCIDGNLFAFPKTMAKLRADSKYDGVFKLYEAVKEVPKIAAYLSGKRPYQYGEGIWRHYPELEEQ
jgi:glutathione S-transferase